MVLVHIICKHQKHSDEVVNFLLKNNLVLDAWVSEKTVYVNHKYQDSTWKRRKIIIMCKTKALLFNTINEALIEKYSHNMPELYCVPIIYMDPDQALRLRQGTVMV